MAEESGELPVHTANPTVQPSPVAPSPEPVPSGASQDPTTAQQQAARQAAIARGLAAAGMGDATGVASAIAELGDDTGSQLLLQTELARNTAQPLQTAAAAQGSQGQQNPANPEGAWQGGQAPQVDTARVVQLQQAFLENQAAHGATEEQARREWDKFKEEHGHELGDTARVTAATQRLQQDTQQQRQQHGAAGPVMGGASSGTSVTFGSQGQEGPGAIIQSEQTAMNQNAAGLQPVRLPTDVNPSMAPDRRKSPPGRPLRRRVREWLFKI